MKENYFSIITVCYNSAKTIERTLQSVLLQSCKDFEYIVVDGDSSDITVDLICQYEKKFTEAGISLIWSSEPDNGIYEAMNKGISKSSGKLIGILNSDDYYLPNTLEIVKMTSKNQNDYDVYHGLLKHTNDGITTMISGTSANRLNRGMIEHPSSFVRNDVYKRFGDFNCSYKYVADYEFMLRIKNAGCKFLMIESILAVFDENGAGNSYKSRKELLILKRNLKLIKNFEYYARNIKLLISEKSSVKVK